MPRARTAYPAFDQAAASGPKSAGDTVIPVLSAIDNGTEDSDGTNNALITTTKGTGRMYWAVTADAGTLTKEQVVFPTTHALELTSGSIAVSAAGVVTLTTVSGLNPSTAYELFFVHVDGNGNMSAAATVGFTTTV